MGGSLFSGLVGVIQKLFTSNYAEYSLNCFLLTAFILILMISGSTLVGIRLNLLSDTKNTSNLLSRKMISHISPLSDSITSDSDSTNSF